MGYSAGAIVNSGALPLHVSGLELSATDAFSLDDDDCAGKVLQPGAECPFVVWFAPPGEGDFSATVTVTSDATGSPHQVVFTGSAVKHSDPPPPDPVGGTPSLMVSPNAFDFTRVDIVRGVRVRNLTGQTGTVTAHLEGPDAGVFTLTPNTCTTPLAPHAICSLRVGFAPQREGAHSATLVVELNGQRDTVALTGTSLVAQPPLLADPTAVQHALTAGLRTARRGWTRRAVRRVGGFRLPGLDLAEGTLRLQVRAQRRPKRLLARGAAVQLAGGGGVSAKLTRSGRAALRRRGPWRVRAVLRYVDSVGLAYEAARTFTLRR